MGNRRVNLTRIYHFSASHRLYSPFLSEEENRNVYGKCGFTTGHGHNYILRVTIRGKIDPKTGTVVNVHEMDEIVRREILVPLDHTHLNIELKNARILTSEVLIEHLWKRLKPFFKDTELHKLELDETKKNRFEYYGS